MRLISADKLRKDVLDLPSCYNGFSDNYDKAMILDLVDEQPTVDAVEVVRCKDCSWWDSNEKTCIEIGGLWRASDFCSWGERREDGT